VVALLDGVGAVDWANAGAAISAERATAVSIRLRMGISLFFRHAIAARQLHWITVTKTLTAQVRSAQFFATSQA
jgi:hypothetical protein